MKLTATFTLLLFFLGSCKEPVIDTKAEGEKLMQLSQEWSKGVATDSIGKILSYWADDATVLPPGQSALKGKKDIRGMLEGTTKIPGFSISWEPLSVEVSKSGDMAYMLEQNKITYNDSLGNPVTEFNKAVSVWKKDASGSWKNVVDIWNADPSRKN